MHSTKKFFAKCSVFAESFMCGSWQRALYREGFERLSAKIFTLGKASDPGSVSGREAVQALPDELRRYGAYHDRRMHCRSASH
jgi:hypothetical protein